MMFFLNFFKLLVTGRILKPTSKIGTVMQNDDYFIPFIDGEFYEYNVYDTSLMFYDVTNFYFEIENEERSNLIIQVGLFMNSDALPVSIEFFPGNTLDAQTFIPSCKSTIDNMNLNRFILVADRGLYTNLNMYHINKVGNNGYIVSKSIKRSTKKDQEWIIDSSDYIKHNNDFKYKERIVNIEIIDENGQRQILPQKQVVYWSKKFYDKELGENKSFLEFLEKLNENPHGFRSSKFNKKDISKFLKKEVINEKTGEIIKGSDIKNYVNTEKVKEYKKLMGYYLIVSSELDMPALDIIDKYHNLTKIENEFRILKSTISTRDMFVRKRNIFMHT